MRMEYLKGVATLALDREACNGCGVCLKVCPHAVLEREGPGGRVRIATLDACMECGACSRNCPRGALTVKAGVGCAYAVINNMLGRKSACCNIEEEGEGEPPCSCGGGSTPCC